MLKERLPLMVNILTCLVMGAVVAVAYSVLRQPLPRVLAELARPSDVQLQVDRAPEARLLGADVSGGIVPPALQISGLVASGDGGAAVLSIEGRPSQAYVVGEELVNGWILTQVTPEEVVIERSGRASRVRMPERPPVAGMVLTESEPLVVR